MLRLRSYKNCDVKYIVKWIKDEVVFRCQQDTKDIDGCFYEERDESQIGM